MRSGDEWPNDAGRSRNRSEFSGSFKWPFDTDVWLSFAFRIPSASVLSGQTIYGAGQLHATEDAGDISNGPIFAHRFEGETLKVVTRSNTAQPTPQLTGVPTTRWTASGPLARDTWIRFVYQIQVSQSGGGFLRGWMDGVEHIAAASIPIGYNDTTGPYWKYGIYRVASSSLTVLDYCNVEVSTSSLLGRVANPLALPS